LPDHSSLTRIRQRWGAERFRRIFECTVLACLEAKIAKAEIVHVDASLIRADVSWESLVARHVEAVAAVNPEDEEAERRSRKTGKYKKVSTTDPDATNGRNGGSSRRSINTRAVDDLSGVVLDVTVTTGEINEGQVLESQIDAVAALTGEAILTVTVDAGYAYGKIYGGLERRKIEALIPAKAEPIRSPVPLRRFRYDARHDIVKCRNGRILRPSAADQARPVLLFPRPGLRTLPDAPALPVAGSGQQGHRDRRRPAGAAPGPPPARAMVRRRPAPLSAPLLAGRRRPRRSEDLARPRPRRASRPRY